jgi:adenine-specific DNA-methyltransferase
MVAYVLTDEPPELFDPAVGAGAFFRAARDLAGESLALKGYELHASALAQAKGLSKEDLAGVEYRDFVLDSSGRRYPAIVANPPYVRHHRIEPAIKARLRELGISALGEPLDARAGLHVFFLIQALQRLAVDGRLAFIVPADTFEGVFAPRLWRWISEQFRIDAVATFAPDASPFPGVDTNAVIVCIHNAPPSPHLRWMRCHERETPALEEVLGGHNNAGDSVTVAVRDLPEAIRTGLSREPMPTITGVPLRTFARVVRGIATGANDFFFLTREQVSENKLPMAFFVRAIGRTRDAEESILTSAALDELESAGRPTHLLSLGASPKSQLPETIRAYLAKGELEGLPNRALIRSRRPWYRMESRRPPELLFAYLGRRNARFIRNRAGVVPLTGFLCIYPEPGVDPDVLFRVLDHPSTRARLPLVGKSYGGGAIKVEPRALERLMLPEDVLAREGLEAAEPLALPV